MMIINSSNATGDGLKITVKEVIIRHTYNNTCACTMDNNKINYFINPL